jgi:hypothetical protein
LSTIPEDIQIFSCTGKEKPYQYNSVVEGSGNGTSLSVGAPLWNLEGGSFTREFER